MSVPSGSMTTGCRAACSAVQSSIGAFGFFVSQFLMLYNFARCAWFREGMQPAPARVWEGAHGLEWTVPSPAPYHTFETPPVVDGAEVTSVHDDLDALDKHKQFP